MIEYIGKCLLIDKKILVVGDLHLGYGESLRRSGVFLPANVYALIKEDLELVFSAVGKVEEIVFLGDVKHAIGTILGEERQQLMQLITFISNHCTKIVVVKGNHDVLLEPLLRDFAVHLVDSYQYKDIVFVHGNKDVAALHEKGVGVWVMGHAHAAITLTENSKAETYKCFLVGMYKGKHVIILPSFFPFAEGSDPRYSAFDLAWEFPLASFQVKVVGEGLDVLDFGQLKKIP